VLDPVVRILQECGVEMYKETERQSLSELHRAVLLNLPEFLPEYRDALDAQDCFGNTALHYAVLCSHREAARDLVQLRANPTIPNGSRKRLTAMHLACLQGNEHMVQEFLSFEALDVNQPTATEGTCAHLAVKSMSLPILTMLAEARVDMNGRDSKGLTPLHMLAKDCMSRKNDVFKEMFLVIVKGANADIDAQDSEGRTALHYAAWAGNHDILELLIARGVDLEVKDCRGRTALHYSIPGVAVGVGSGMSSCVPVLLQAGCDVEAKDSNGLTASDFADILRKGRSWHKAEDTAIQVAQTRIRRLQGTNLAEKRADEVSQALLEEELAEKAAARKARHSKQ